MQHIMGDRRGALRGSFRHRSKAPTKGLTKNKFPNLGEDPPDPRGEKRR